MSETGSEPRSGIGARLRAGRERMGLTLLQAAEKMHVDPKVVESLESERFEALGAVVFVRGHLRRYAELIGESAAPMLDLLPGGANPAMPDLTRLPKAAPESNPSRLAVPALLVLIGFVLLGVVWWVMQSVRNSSANPPPAAREVPLEPELSSSVADAVDLNSAGVDTAGAAVPGAAASGAIAGAPVGAAPALGTQPGRAQNSAGASPATAATAPAVGATPAGAATAATPAAGKPLEVTLRFSADSWVEVYDAKGEKLFYDIGSADSQRKISGTPPFRVTFGNAPGVTLDVNGKPAEVPASAVRDDTAQFVINRSGRIVRARQQTEGQ